MAMTPKGWSISALAVELGRDRRTVAAAVGTLTPMAREGKSDLYRLTDVLPLLLGEGKPTDFDDAKARKMAAEAELAEIELATKRGELVPVSVAITRVVDEYTAVRSKLLAIPSKMAPLVAAESAEAVCRALLLQIITEALNELVGSSGGGDDGGPDEGSNRRAQAAADVDGERMGGHLSQAFL